MSKFHTRLKSAMDKKGMTQAALARALETDPATVNKYVRGKHMIREDRVHLIAKALDVTVEDLLGYNPVTKEIVEERAPVIKSVTSNERRKATTARHPSRTVAPVIPKERPRAMAARKATPEEVKREVATSEIKPSIETAREQLAKLYNVTPDRVEIRVTV